MPSKEAAANAAASLLGHLGNVNYLWYNHTIISFSPLLPQQ